MKFVVPADAKTWAPVSPDSHFPIQNLPFGKFIDPRTERDEVGIRIGDQVLVLGAVGKAGLLESWTPDLAVDLAEIGGGGLLSKIRHEVYVLLHDKNARLRDDGALCKEALIPVEGLEMLMPVFVRGYVDFYSGIHHATNVGKMFRPDQPPLLPNYRYLPVGYGGRSSSMIVSGEPIVRPRGQTKPPGDAPPTYGPTKELDFELEMGFIVGEGNELGDPIPIAEAENHILGLVMVNDWSARDIQRWEYQPLGPFLAKSFGTSVSPWIVTLDALEPFRIEGMKQEPGPLPHLRNPGPAHFDIQLEVSIQTQRMQRPQTICRSNTKNLYWTMSQQLAHLTSNGANVEPGDICASGTISGEMPGTFGSMLELAWKGEKPLELKETGEKRAFLEDGDTVVMSGWAQGKGFRAGFGELTGTVLPAK